MGNIYRKHSHIIVVGIDGAGSFIKDADTPNFDRIFANGAVTCNAVYLTFAALALCTDGAPVSFYMGFHR